MLKKNKALKLSAGLGLAASLLAVAWISGCGKDNGTDPGATSAESASEIAGSAVAGAVNSSSSTGTMALNLPFPGAKSWASRLFPPMSLAWASNPACPTLASPPACSGNTLTLNYSHCSFGASAATWNGSQLLTWTAGTCGTAANGATFTRTFGAGTQRTGALGVVVSLDTSNPSGYSSTNAGGGTTVVWTSATSRTLNVNGIHYVATKSYKTSLGVDKTATVWDHTVSTPSPLTLSSGSIASGSISVQHNLAKYVGTANIVTALTFSAGCCHPTAGEIDTALSGSQTGTEKLVYTSTCGQASFTPAAPGASAQTITLAQCL